ncbi:MAG: polysaccharide export protein [Nitrospirae bacterium]|nr:polysaccharide export protein [Nitrospirota bacterium]
MRRPLLREKDQAGLSAYAGGVWFVVLLLLLGLSTGCAKSSPLGKDQAEGLGAIGSVPRGAAKQDPDTIIEPGDTLEIIVRRGAGEEKYAATVLTSGVITVSFQDINVRGLTEVEAEARVARELSAVIKHPRVQVRLAQKRILKPKNFYIFGEVKSAGKQLMEKDATLLHALGQAGGYTDVAALDRVIVISRPKASADNPVIRVANVDRFLKEGDLSADIPLNDNDVIFVPRDKVGDWNHYYTKAFLPILNSLTLATSAVFIGKSLEMLFSAPSPGSTQTSVPVGCWVARALYGDHGWQVPVLRWYIWGPLSEHWYGKLFADLYLQYGERAAAFLRQHPSLQQVVKPLFDHLLDRAIVAVSTGQAARADAAGLVPLTPYVSSRL